MKDQHGNPVTLPPGHTCSMYAGSAGFLYVPLTLLDTRETIGRPSPIALYSSLKSADDSSVSFRHSKHAWHRDRVLNAFARLETDLTRQYAYANCGSEAWLMQSESDRSRFSIRSATCHDRWCPACAKTRANVIRSNLDPLVEGKEIRLITLTLKHTPDPLTVKLDRLSSCFTTLRKTKLWKDAVDGGASFTEVKINPNTMQWHPHMHIIAVGRYLPLAQLCAAWLVVTGDSHICDIRIVRDPKKVAGYVTKYCTKPAENDLYRIPAALGEAILAMKGRRLVSTFGAWRTTALLHYDPQDEWRPVLDWSEFISRVKAGNQWCIRAMNCIKTYEFDANHPTPPDGTPELDWSP